MFKRILIIFMCSILCHITSMAQCTDEGSMLIYSYEDGLSSMVINYPFQEQVIEEKAIKLFTLLTTIDYNKNQIKLIPRDSKIQSAMFNEGHLTIIFNKNILDYGGNTYEFYLINQLLYSFFSIDEANMISFYIENSGSLFTEGTEIIDYTKEQFLERMNQYESY